MIEEIVMSRSNSTYSLDEYESSGPRPPVPGEEEFKKVNQFLIDSYEF